MILSELNNLILAAVNANYLVKQAFVGDVYDINSKENKFGCFVATPMKARKTTDGTITYNYILYYVDRLTKDESNIDFVQTDAVNLLSGLIKWLEDYGVQVENEYLFTMFRHQFDDWCAGAYVEVDLMVPDQGCGENDFIKELKGEITPILITGNGTYTPPAGYGYGPVYVNVTSGGGEVTPEWVDNEIDFKLIGYATQSWVNAQGFITSETIPTDIATQSWVQAQGYLTSVDLDGYATESWVSSQQFATETYVSDQISGVQSWVLNKSYITAAALTGYATEAWVTNQQFATQVYVSNQISGVQEWVLSQGYITSETIPADIATQSWVQSQGYITSATLNGYATESWVLSQSYITSNALSGYATESWVLNKSYITSAALTGYATESWVSSQQFATETYVSNQISGVQDWVLSQSYITSAALTGYATETYVGSQISGVQDWVLSQSYITSNALTGYATESWVLSQSYITSAALTGYATESWVSSQQFATTTYVGSQISDVQSWVLSQSYITSNALTGYATESWVQSQDYLTSTSSAVTSKLNASDVWTGTVSAWESLTSEQQCSYLIALIVTE